MVKAWSRYAMSLVSESFSVPSENKGLSLKYACKESMLSLNVQHLLRELSYDDETKDWVNNTAPKGLLWETTRRFLMFGLSLTNANAVLGGADMHVFSQSQVSILLNGRRGGRLLDIGAGDGGVTAKLAPFFDEVICTERAYFMTRRLRQRGYTVIKSESVPATDTYDVISCLNVLDRCPKPVSLLQQMRASLKPDGCILIATVLPHCPWVEGAPVEEFCNISNDCFTSGVSSWVNNVFLPLGFNVECVSRTPYLCRGDTRRMMWELDDAVFVLTKGTIPNTNIIIDTKGLSLLYKCNLEEIPANHIARQTWKELDYDAGTQVFVNTVKPKSSWWLRFRRWLMYGMSLTNANGLLGGAHMHVISTEQVKRLLNEVVSISPTSPRHPSPRTLLDIGAGDGGVTAKFAPYFDTIICTERAYFMTRRLKKSGYIVINNEDISSSLIRHTFKQHNIGESYSGIDVITCLNVLDRCSKPRTLLLQMRELIKEDGVIVVATVLPHKPFVEGGTLQEFLTVDNTTFETGIQSWIDNVFIPLEFEVVSVSRCPYLCRGDSRRYMWELDDALFVLRRKNRDCDRRVNSERMDVTNELQALDESSLAHSRYKKKHK